MAANGVRRNYIPSAADARDAGTSHCTLRLTPYVLRFTFQIRTSKETP